MANSESEDMPTTSVRTETEWSTREKLAIASYVLRTGEQHWSGAGRILKPLGEPGRPADWFSPKFCAQQYTALMGQHDVPKRKRGGDRSDSTENIQPGPSSGESIIARLTKERIEELKKKVRQERTDYRKLKRDIEMIEAGEFDDQLDRMLKQLNDGDEEIILPDLKPTESMEILQKVDKDVVSENSNSIVETSNTVNDEQMAMESQPEVKLESESSKETNETEPKIQEESSDMTEKMDTTSTIENNTETQDCITIDATEEPQGEVVSVKDSDSVELTVSAVKDEANEITSVDVEHNTGQETVGVSEMATVAKDNSNEETKDEQMEEQEMKTEDGTEPEQLVKATESSTTDKNMDAPPAKEEEPSVETPAEEPDTYNMPLDEDLKQSISLPGTPAQSSSYVYDSFPSSPALSHSSDMDPDATASWKAWRKSIMILWKQVASHRYASLFLQPVTDDIAPNYSTTVYRSTDLATIKKHIEGGAIRTTSEFCRDIMLMFQNAIMYNSNEHDVFKWTLEMQKDVMDQITQFRSTQMMVETTQPPENKSLRRSTMRRSALSEKTTSTRSRRSAANEIDNKTSR